MIFTNLELYTLVAMKATPGIDLIIINATVVRAILLSRNIAHTSRPPPRM